MMMRLLLVLVFAAGINGGASARELIAGPVIANVLKVYDGDTIEVLAKVWPGHQINVRVRIRGIDAPEMRAKCPMERRAAVIARDRLQRFIAGRPVKLLNIRGGKYYGRVLADVEDHAGSDVETALLEAGLVRPYRGRHRSSWC